MADQLPPAPVKPIYMSRTLWVQVLGLVAMFVAQKSPQGGEFIRTYFSEVGIGWAVVNVALRLITKDSVSI